MNRVELLDAALAELPGRASARMTRVELAPGQAAGAHRHPCDVLGVVLEGTVHYEREGQAPVTLRAGDAFHEPRGARIVRFDNASADAGAAFVACYLLPPGLDEVIELE